jgi:hypothetical protein
MVVPLVFALAVAAAPAAAGPQPLLSLERVRAVCLGLRPVERVSFTGSPDRIAKARDAYRVERDRLRQTTFSVEIPWGTFVVSSWDPEQKRVTVSTEKPFRALAGALSLVDPDLDELQFEAVEEAHGPLQAGLSKGTLSLLLTFKPAEEDESPCVASKAEAFTLLMDLTAAELRAAGKPVARATGEGFEPAARTSGKPTVTLRRAPVADAAANTPAALKSVEKVKPALEQCYRDALAKRPALDGSLILALAMGASGKVEAKEVMADSLQDAATLECIKAALAQARLPAGTPRALVGIDLERK